MSKISKKQLEELYEKLKNRKEIIKADVNKFLQEYYNESVEKLLDEEYYYEEIDDDGELAPIIENLNSIDELLSKVEDALDNIFNRNKDYIEFDYEGTATEFSKKERKIELTIQKIKERLDYYNQFNDLL